MLIIYCPILHQVALPRCDVQPRNVGICDLLFDDSNPLYGSSPTGHGCLIDDGTFIPSGRACGQAVHTHTVSKVELLKPSA